MARLHPQQQIAMHNSATSNQQTPNTSVLKTGSGVNIIDGVPTTKMTRSQFESLTNNGPEDPLMYEGDSSMFKAPSHPGANVR